jgi:vancomycin permeability regulator SanA
MTVSVLTVSGLMKNKVKSLILEIPSGEYDCILVLGAKVTDGVPCARLADRLDNGIELYKAGFAKKLLLSGDGEHPDEYDEVAGMKAYAISRGVPEEDIIEDIYGLSTYESIWRAKNIYGIRSMIISTQEYHLSRAIFIAGEFSLSVCGVPADRQDYAQMFLHNLREILARFKDYYFAQAKPLPNYTE